MFLHLTYFDRRFTRGDLIQGSVHASFHHLGLRCFDHLPFTASAPSCVAEAPQGKGGTRLEGSSSSRVAPLQTRIAKAAAPPPLPRTQTRDSGEPMRRFCFHSLRIQTLIHRLSLSSCTIEMRPSPSPSTASMRLTQMNVRHML